MRPRYPLSLLTREVPRLHLFPTNTCLLLQDIHAPFADGTAGWLANRADAKVVRREFDEYYDGLDLATPNITKTLARIRSLGIPVLYSCLGYQPPQEPSTFQQAMGWTWNLTGPDGEFPESWQPQPDELVFSKPGWGALTNPELARHLRDRQIATVIVMGMMYDYGIRQTCMELADRGIGALVISDAVVSLTDAGRGPASGTLSHGMTKLRSTGETLDLLNVFEKEGSVLI